MMHRLRLIAGALAAAAFVVGGGAARAQTPCESLPNPIVVGGSNDFAFILKQFAVDMAVESPPVTVISVVGGGQTTSCGAVAGVVGGMDLGGLSGRYYTVDGKMVTTNACAFSAGRTTDVAISDIFYESCTNVTQPKPDDVADVLGPAQATAFVVPLANTATQAITYAEARAIYGCGVSSTRKVAGLFATPADVLCRNPDVGTQITIAKNIGLPEAMMAPPRCTVMNVEDTMLAAMVVRPMTPAEPLGYTPPADGLGFLSASQVYLNGAAVTPLAYQALGQNQAYLVDSSPVLSDRRNVRDGHYRLWGYVHMIMKTSGGKPSSPGADLIGWINATKPGTKADYFELATTNGLIPQCAMKVQRTADGGPLSSFAPTEPCSCSFEALATRSIPVGCKPCTSPSVCGCGSTCRRGFCE